MTGLRRALLAVLNGPHAGHEFDVPEGAPRTVGAVEADYLLRDDPWLDPVHAAFYWDRGQLHVKDFGTRHGVRVNEERVAERALHDRDLVQLGGTLLRVALEGQASRESSDLVAPQGFRDRLTHLRWLLGRARYPVYAVLDAARDEQVLASLLGSDTNFRSLYEGWQAESLADVAPYLVRLPADAPFVDRLLGEGFGRAWGVFVTSDLPFDELRRHLRQHLRVTDEDGRTLLFRWYDPRVLRTYLPTCTPWEAQVFFGPIETMHCEGPHGAAWLSFTSTPEALHVDVDELPYPPVPTAFEGEED